MSHKPKKLSLNQETLRTLSKGITFDNQFGGSHTCTTPTACTPFSCTLAPC